MFLFAGGKVGLEGKVWRDPRRRGKFIQDSFYIFNYLQAQTGLASRAAEVERGLMVATPRGSPLK